MTLSQCINEATKEAKKTHKEYYIFREGKDCYNFGDLFQADTYFNGCTCVCVAMSDGSIERD